MAVSFGTDATAQTSSTATSLAITIPSSGISVGDPVFLMTWAATTTGSAYSTQTWSTSGTTPVQLTGGIAQMHYLGLSTYITAQAWVFTAASGDIGTTLTLNASVTGNLGIGLVTYPGASTTPDCLSAVGTTGFGTTFAVPPVTTVSASDWILYLVGDTASSLSAHPGTLRASGSDARTCIADSNGSIGGAGTMVGGTAVNYKSSSLAVWAGFTIGINVPGFGPPVLQGASVSDAVPAQAIPGFIPGFPGGGVSCTGSMALAPVAMAAADAETFSCTASMALAPKAIAASGAEKFSCTGSMALASRAMSGSGTEKITATGSMALALRALAASCAERFSCAGSLHLASLAMNGSANGLVTSAGSLHLAPKAMAASGAEAFHATGSAHLAPRAIAATAAEVLAATGALALPPQAMSASGAERFTASGSLLLASPAMAAEGGGAAAGSVRLAPLAMSGAGKNVRQALRPGGAVAPRLLPNTELVCISWLKTIPGLTADVVATQTPADETQWQANGCITVQAIGGRPDPDMPIAHPVVQLDFWAVNPGSNKPPWFKAASLAEQVRMAAYDRLRVCRIVTVSAGGVRYEPARVLTAFLLTEPRRIWHDAGDYARYSADLAMSWHPVAPVLEPI